MTFTLAIVGRPNVGKSTLFNRLVGRRLALVDNEPGLTRDRREADARLGGFDFRLIDTAGLEEPGRNDLLAAMQAQTEIAVVESDAVLFVIDARAGVLPDDERFADILRKTGRPIILVANKCEGTAGNAGVLEAFSLGLGEAVAMSAEHGEGLNDLFDELKPYMEQVAVAGGVLTGAARDDENRPLTLAIVGRPNAGKSTLINQLLGEDRLLAGPQAGMTRDAIAVHWRWRGRPVRLIDTAGLRKRARVVEKLEKLSVADALRAVRFAEVVVLVIDARKPFDKQDLHVADYTAREGRALVIAVNKWDLMDDKQKVVRELKREVDRLLPQVRGVPLVFLSALSGKGVGKLMPAVFDVYQAWNRRIATAKLNTWLQQAVLHHPPPAVRGRRIRLRYITQAKSRPPTFIVFCSRPESLPESYSRYLINEIREVFNIMSVPIRLKLRKGENPYVSKNRK